VDGDDEPEGTLRSGLYDGQAGLPVCYAPQERNNVWREQDYSRVLYSALRHLWQHGFE
jgi:hypothetical protein